MLLVTFVPVTVQTTSTPPLTPTIPTLPPVTFPQTPTPVTLAHTFLPTLPLIVPDGTVPLIVPVLPQIMVKPGYLPRVVYPPEYVPPKICHNCGNSHMIHVSCTLDGSDVKNYDGEIPQTASFDICATCNCLLRFPFPLKDMPIGYYDNEEDPYQEEELDE